MFLPFSVEQIEEILEEFKNKHLGMCFFYIPPETINFKNEFGSNFLNVCGFVYLIRTHSPLFRSPSSNFIQEFTSNTTTQKTTKKKIKLVGQQQDEDQFPGEKRGIMRYIASKDEEFMLHPGLKLVEPSFFASSQFTSRLKKCFGLMLPKIDFGKQCYGLINNLDLMCNFFFKGGKSDSIRDRFCSVVLEEKLVECLRLVVCGPKVSYDKFCSLANQSLNKSRSELRKDKDDKWSNRDLKKLKNFVENRMEVMVEDFELNKEDNIERIDKGFTKNEIFFDKLFN